jgi:hypothetical protein
MTNRGIRYVNVVLGAWLFTSAFVWPHSPEQFTNTWSMGVLTVFSAVLAMGMPAVRFVNTLVGIWLVLSSFMLPRLSATTAWHNVAVGIAIALVSLLVSRRADPWQVQPRDLAEAR